MKNSSVITKIIAEVGIFAAIGWILDEIQGAWSVSFTSGGSIGIAMVAVLIMAYRRGWLPAICTGLIMGLLDLATKAYIIHPAQLFLDYILPYALVGIAGLFKPLFDKEDDRNKKIMWLSIGAVAGGLLKFLSHFLAGYIFWNDAAYFAWNLNYMSAGLYSFVYNIAYIGPSIVVSLAMLIILFLKAPRVIMTTGESIIYVEDKEQKRRTLGTVISSALITVGLFLFVFFLIKYVKSAKVSHWGSETDYRADGDSMVIFVSGIALAILGIYTLITSLKNKLNLKITSLVLGSIILAFSFYGLAKIIKMYADHATEGGSINNLYWAWFIPSLIIGSLFVTMFIVAKVKQHKKA